MHDLFEKLKDKQLHEGDFAIFGSAPLFGRGIIQHMSDVGMLPRAAWGTIQKVGTLQYNDDYDVAIVTLNDGRMTFGNKWGIGNMDVDVLIDEAKLFDEVHFVP